MATLFLLPCPLAADTVAASLPADVQAIARGLGYFLAENSKSARAFLKSIGHPLPLRDIEIVEIGHHPEPAAIEGWLAPVLAGRDAAVVSEAGCPGVADPGSSIVAAAHRFGLRVRPLIGPSSILLALMASGMDGQRFRFHGYLPVAAAERTRRLHELEREARRGETQIFIETPYRSSALYGAILAACAPSTRLALAVDLTSAAELIHTRTVAEWQRLPPPDLERRPAVFLLAV